MDYYVCVIVLGSTRETLLGTFNEHCAVGGARRTSLSNIASILPSLRGFGSGEGFSTNIIIHSNDQPPIVPYYGD